MKLSTPAPICRVKGDRIQEIGRLRHEVWRQKGQDVPHIWLDDDDEGGCHFACCEEGRMIAAARVSLHATAFDLPHQKEFQSYLALLEPLSPFAYLSRLIVSEEFTGCGYGTRLVQHSLHFAKEHLASTLVILAVDDVREWFLKLGFDYKGKGGILPAEQPHLTGVQAHVMLYPLHHIAKTSL